MGNGTIVIKTKYCHEYVRDEEAILQTSEDGGENALLFATGAYCEVVGVNKEKRPQLRRVIDFLIDLWSDVAQQGHRWRDAEANRQSVIENVALSAGEVRLSNGHPLTGVLT